MVEANSLSMNFGPVVAVADASFKALKGEVMGLLGPNGAGKTTTMKILTTQIVATSGQASVAGFDVRKNPLEVRKRVGYLPETPPLYGDMEVAEYLNFVGKARAISESALKTRIDFVVNACGIREVFRSPINTLSRGYGQRVGLAQALIHDPEVLILDEPTSGLDPIQIIEIRDLVKSLAHDKTVIFSTHILQEVEAIADKVVIITEGSIVADGTLNELEAETRGKQRFTITASVSESDFESALNNLKNSINFDFRLNKAGEYLTARIEADEGLDIWTGLSSMVHQGGWQVKEFYKDKSSLESAFRYYVKEGAKLKTAKESAV
jgi:ABC-2 type transport system ATP-binding protein